MPSTVLHPQVISDYFSKETSLGRKSQCKEISLGRNTGLFSTLSINPWATNQPVWWHTKKVTIWKMETNNRSILSPYQECQWQCGMWSVLIILHNVYLGRKCNSDHAKIQHRISDGQNWYRASILTCSSAHKWPLTSGSLLARQHIHPSHTTIWAVLRAKIFNAITDAFQWIVEQQGVCTTGPALSRWLIVIGPPETTNCQEDLHTLLRTASKLGIPIAQHKTKGSATCLTYLGIEINTVFDSLQPSWKTYTPCLPNGVTAKFASGGTSNLWLVTSTTCAK